MTKQTLTAHGRSPMNHYAVQAHLRKTRDRHCVVSRSLASQHVVLRHAQVTLPASSCISQPCLSAASQTHHEPCSPAEPVLLQHRSREVDGSRAVVGARQASIAPFRQLDQHGSIAGAQVQDVEVLLLRAHQWGKLWRASSSVFQPACLPPPMLRASATSLLGFKGRALREYVSAVCAWMTGVIHKHTAV